MTATNIASNTTNFTSSRRILSSESCSVKHHRQDYTMKSDDCTAGGNVTVAKHKVACKQCKVSQANAQLQAGCVVGSWNRTRNYADVKCVSGMPKRLTGCSFATTSGWTKGTAASLQQPARITTGVDTCSIGPHPIWYTGETTCSFFEVDRRQK